MIKVHKALKRHLIKLNPAIPTIWENEKATPDAAKPYLEAFFVPASTAALSVGIGGFNENLGFFQINVHTPIDKGTKQNDEICDQLIELFEIGTSLCEDGQGVTVNSQNIARIYSAPAVFSRALTFNYSALKQRK